MNIFVKNHSQITHLISENKGRLSEAELVSLVNYYADTEFASEIAVEQLMWQAKPKTLLIERAVEGFGGIEFAFANLECFLGLLRSINLPDEYF